MGAVGDTRPRAKGGAFAAGAGEERDKLDPFELVVLALGFGLCRAWVVGFLAFAARYSLIESGLFGYDQVYLFAGALAAILVSCLSCAHRPGSPVRCAVRNAGADASKDLSDAPIADSVRFALANIASCIVSLCMLGAAASTLTYMDTSQLGRPNTVARFSASTFLPVAFGPASSRCSPHSSAAAALSQISLP